VGDREKFNASITSALQTNNWADALRVYLTLITTKTYADRLRPTIDGVLGDGQIVVDEFVSDLGIKNKKLWKDIGGGGTAWKVKECKPRHIDGYKMSLKGSRELNSAIRKCHQTRDKAMCDGVEQLMGSVPIFRYKQYCMYANQTVINKSSFFAAMRGLRSKFTRELGRSN